MCSTKVTFDEAELVYVCESLSSLSSSQDEKTLDIVAGLDMAKP